MLGGALTVTVLLAVYNGEKYLAEQIESLLTQTESNFRILIRDDGSCDGSQKIIASYIERYPEKISAIHGAPTGNSRDCFAALLESADDDYVMFCDQDDVWLPEKIEITLAAMKKAESENGNMPILVHGDLSVVDSNLNVISNSFFEYQRLYQENVSLPALLVQNYITGCTVMINRALKQKCSPIPRECIMHDWWLALNAAIYGKIVCIDKPLLLYRQHNNNQVGAKASYGIGLIKRKLATLDRVRENYNATYRQAAALLNSLDGEFEKERELLTAYCSMEQKRKLQKIAVMNKYGFKKGTALRVLGQYFLM